MEKTEIQRLYEKFQSKNKIKMKNILVTGANGQLGNEIKLLSSDHKTFNFFYTDIDNLDITDTNAVELFLKTNDIKHIINCAAYTAVDKAEDEFEKAYKINVLGPENLKNNAEKLDIPLLHVSTDYVFDGKNYKPYLETDDPNPQGIYGRTKLDGEKSISDYKKSLIIRTSWLYSSFGNNFVKTIIEIAKQKSELSVVVDQIGNPTNASDLASAILQISEKILTENKKKFGVFNFSNEGVCSWYDFAKAIVDIKNIKTKIIPVNSDKFPRKAPRPHYSVLDKSKIKETFNISINNWYDSLRNCLEKL